MDVSREDIPPPTYGERRMFVLNEQASVSGILLKYKALSRPAVVGMKISGSNSIVYIHIHTHWKV